MPSEIKVISTSAKGQEKTFTYKPGAKHMAVMGADIKFVVDGNPGLPLGTKVARKGKSVGIEFSDGQCFEVSNASDECLMNFSGAQVLDAKTGPYVAAQSLGSDLLALAGEGTAEVVPAEAGSDAAGSQQKEESRFNPIYLAPLLLLAAAGGGGGGGGSSSGGTENPQSSALARIKAYADSDGAGTAVLSESDFRSAGVSGVTAENLTAINSALASAKVAGADVDTVPKVQALIDAYNKILGQANGAAPDATPSDPTAADYAGIGANIGTAITDPDALGLLNNAIGGKNPADVDTVAEINALAAMVDKVMNAAAGGTPTPTAAELTALGVPGVTDNNLPAVLAALAATPDDGSGVNTLSKLQAVADAAVAAQAAAADKIQAFANDNTSPAPTAADYTAAGVKGVDAGNLSAINNAIDALTGPQADTTVEVQALVDAYNKILGEANGAAPDATPADPTPADYAAIGANIGTAATNPEALALLNDVIGSKNPADVDSPAEIAALAAIVDKVMNAAAGGTPVPTAAELAAVGLTSVTPANLAEVLAALAATPDDGSGVSTLAELQTVVNAATGADAALSKIAAYAADNTQAAPTAADYIQAGVTGVDATNLPAINSAIDALGGPQTDTAAEVQAVVDAYKKILGEANGAAPDATPADPTAADYAAIGANIGTAATDPDALALLNDVIGGKNPADVDTPAEIAALAAIVDKVMNAAAGGTPVPTAAELASLGLTGVTPETLPAILAAIAATPDDGSSVNTLSELQAATDAGVVAAAAAAAAQAAIVAFANDNTQPAPTAADYTTMGVTGVALSNVAAINSAVDALTGPQVDTPAEVQAIVDAYNKILAEANSAAPDATPGVNPTAADYAAVGANVGTAATDPEALSLLNNAIGAQAATGVDTVPEINALAAIVDKVMNAAAGGTPTPTAADLAALGVTGVTDANLPAMLAALALTPDDGSGVDALSELQALADTVAGGATVAQAKIVAYANDNTQAAPTAADYTAAGVTGVDASNLPAINSALDALSGTQVDTPAEVQAVVNAYTKILAEANGVTPDATPVDPTAADYAAIGANIGTAATDAEALALLNDVIGGKAATDVDTPAEIAALAAIVDKVMNAAAGGTPTPTVADLTALGLTGVTPENLPAILAALAATPDDGTGIDNLSELQAVTDAAAAAATAAQAKIVAYANDNTQAAPTAADYTTAGVTGVDASNLPAINSALDALSGTQVDTPAEVQAVVNAYTKILAEANGVTPDATPADPTAADYAAIGANIGTAATDAEALALLNDVIGGKAATDVDTPAEITALAAIVDKVMNAAAGGTPTPTVADLAALGVSGVTDANLPAMLAALALTSDDGSGVDALSELQALADTVAGGATAAQAKIVAYANDNTQAVPNATDYALLGVTGVDATNLPAINSALDALPGTAVDTPAEVQTIVDVYTKILSEANGSAPDATPGVNPTAADYAAIGANVGTAATHPEALSLLNNAIGAQAATGVDTVPEINALAAIVDKVMNAAAGGTPVPTAADLAALGVSGVTPANLPAVLAAIAATPDSGTGVDTLSELQAVTDAAAAAATAAQNKIAAYADANTNPAPTLGDYTTAGVTGVDATNLPAINSAVDALVGTHADTAPEVQAIVDAYAKILAEANGSAADATPGVNPTAADYAAIGANVGMAVTDPEALSLLNNAIGAQLSTGVDTVAEINALAAIVDKVMNAAAGGTPVPTAAELTALGISGVTAANLPAVLAALAATPDNGTGVDTLSELQTVADAATAGAAAAQAKIVTYANDNTQSAPTAADYTATGVTGVDATNLSAINSAVDALTGTNVGTPAEVQALVDVYTKILAEANGAAADATPGVNPTAADYAAIGANVGTAATDPEALSLLNNAIGVQPSTGVDTVPEINALAAIVDRVMNAAAGGTPVPTVADLTALGLTGVTPDNLPAVLAAIAATPDDGTGVDTLSELQAVATAAITAATAAEAKIAAYADSNTNPAPVLADYTALGVKGVDATNLPAINSAVDALVGTQVDTAAEVQALVDAYAKILAEANGAVPDATPGVNPTAADYAAIGASVGTAATDPEALSLLNNAIGAQPTTGVDTVAEINALGSIVDKVMNAAAGGTPVPTVAELTALGVTGVTSANLAAVLAAIAATPDNGTGVDTLSELQAVADSAAGGAAAAQAKIVAYANDNTQPAPTLADYTALGVTGVDASTLPAINSAVDALVGANVDTPAEVQVLVDAYAKILAEANGAAPDATPGANPTAADYAALGANVGTAATDPEALSLLNNAIGAQVATSVDTVPEINALAAIVDKVMNAAAGGTPVPTAADLAALGVTGVTPANLPAVLAAIAATPDTGSGVDTLGGLQAVTDAAVAAATAAQNKIVAYANDNTQAAPTVADYSALGVTGVDATHLPAINSAVDALGGTAVDTTAEVQALIDAYSKILTEANGSAPDANPAVNPTAADYAAIGANVGTAATDPEALSLLNQAIGNQPSTGVDTVAEINALGSIVDKVMNAAAAGTPTPTAADLSALGITGVTAANLPAVLAAIAATPDSGAGVDTLAELQAVADSATGGLSAAQTKIVAYANDNTQAAPTLADYTALAVTGVDATNLPAINSAVDALTSTAVDTPAEVQALVDAYTKILAEANGAVVDATPGANPTAADYAAIGANVGAAATDPEALSLLNEAIGAQPTTGVDTVAEINALAAIVDKVMNAVAGGTPVPTAAELTALGLTGVSAANLPAVLAAIAATPDSGTGVDTLSELQAVADAAVLAATAAQNKIVAYADDNTSPAPSVADYTALGITGIDATNLPAINSAVDALVGTNVDTPAEVQALVNAYTKILAEANGAAADATPGIDPIAVDYTAIGANVGTAATDPEALSLLNNVIGAQAATGVDTVPEINALAAIVDKVMNAAAGGTPVPTAADLAALGVAGVTSVNLPAVLAAIVATPDNGTGVDTLTELQAVADTATAGATTAQAKIVAYANDNTQATPMVVDYAALGVSGVTAANLPAINSAVDALTGTNVDTPAEVQALVDAYAKVLAEANGAAADATPGVNPTVADYTTLGVTLGTAATVPENLALLNDLVGTQSTTGVDTVAELNELARIANAIQLTAAGGTPTPALTAADLTLAGITGVTPANLATVLAAIAAAPDSGTGTDTLAELQTLSDAAVGGLAAAQAKIVAYANDNTQAAPALADYTALGVSGVAAANLPAINSAVDALTGTNVDTPAEVQALVDAYAKVLAEANGAAADATPGMNPTVADYTTLGVTLGTAATVPENLALLNDLVGTQSTTGVDTVAELNKLAQIANAIQLTAAGGTPTPALTAADLTLAGITGVTSANLATVLAAIAAAPDSGTGTDTLAELQTLSDAAVSGLAAAQAKIVAYANDNTQPAPTEADYAAIGVSGVSAGNLTAMNSALDALTGTSVDTPAEVQATVNAYAKILAEANSAAPDATPGVNPLASDYAAIGANIGLAATDVGSLALLNDVIAVNPPFGVDTIAKIQEIARITNAIQLTVAGGTPIPALTAADFDFIQVFDVTPENLPSVLAALAANPDNGAATDTRPELQLLVNQVTAASSTITAYADSNAGTVPAASDYATMGVTGVTAANLDAINSVLASTPVVGTHVDTKAELQAMVDAYTKVLAEANGAAADATPGVNPTVADYTTLGVTLGTATTTPVNLALFNDLVGAQSSVGVDTVAELNELARIANAIQLTAAGGTPTPALTAADLALAGITGVTPANLANVLAAIAAAPDIGTSTDTLAELQTVTDAAAAALAAQAKIVAYANDNTQPVPALDDYIALSATGVTAANLAALNSAVDALTGTNVDTLAEVQALVDAYAKVLAEANGSAPDATPGVNPTVADYTALGVVLGTAATTPVNLALFNDLVGAQPMTGVDTVPELNELARIANAIQLTVAGGTPTPALTAADLALAGITGVTAANLPAVLAAIAAAPDSGTGTDTLAELQTLATAASKIVDYANDNTQPVPTAADYAALGITGVNVNASLSAINSAVDALVGTNVDTTPEIQAVVDAYSTILLQAGDPFATQATAAEYATIGANIGLAATDPQNLSLLDTIVTDLNNPSKADSIAEINELARIANALQTVVAGGTPTPALTLADFATVGLAGVTADNLSAVLARFAAQTDDGTATPNRLAFQSLIDGVVTAQNTITDYAQNNGGTVPAVADYATLGVTGVTAANVAAINTVLASTPVVGTNVDTPAEVQAIADSYNAILIGANGPSNDNNVNLTQAQINALGLPAIDTPAEVTLFNDIVDNALVASVDTQAELANLARIADAIQLTAAGGTPSPALTAADLAAIGMSWPGAPTLTAPQLASILAGIAATPDDGTGADTLAELQTVLNTAVNFAPEVSAVLISSNAGADNTYKTGDVISITVKMTEAVNVTGVPRISINMGGLARFATYASGSGTDTLVFNFTVSSLLDNDSNGIGVFANSLNLNGGTIKDLTAQNATLTHAALPDNPSHMVDVIAPTQTTVITTIQDDVWTPATTIANNGNIADTTPVINGSLSAALTGTDVLAVYRNGVKLGNAIVTGTTWTYTDTGPVPLGVQNYTARAEDVAGNQGTVSATYKVTEVTPSLSAPDLVVTSDLGDSNTDNVTTDATPTLTGTVVGAINYVTLWNDADNSGTINGTEVALATDVAVTNGTWTWTSPTTMSDGIYQVKAAASNGSGVLTGPVSAVLGTTPDYLNITHTDLRISKSMSGVNTADYFGRDLASIGDFNNDGYEDFVVTAAGADASGGRVDAGKTYVFFGSATGIDTTVNLAAPSALTAGRFLEISGAAVADGGNYAFGATVSRAGDVNGDGIDDFIIGEFAANAPNSADGGSVYVIYGSTTYTTGTLDLNAINGGDNTHGFRIANPATDFAAAYLGQGAGAGDLNNDGYADIIVGVPFYDPLSPARTGAGAVFVVYGGPALGNQLVSQYNIGTTIPGFGLYGGNGNTYATNTSHADDVRLGENAAAVGDVNGDGITDFVVTSPYSNNYISDAAGASAGTAYLVYGKQGGMPSLDLNNFDTSDGIRINAQHYEWLGGSNSFPGHFVRGLGDINGDGVGDFAVSAPYSEPSDPGHVWVFYGQAGGYQADINLDYQVYYNLPGDVTPGADFNAKTGFLIVNEDFTPGTVTNAHAGTYDDWLGVSVSSAGDVNLDGIDDILVGARYADGPSVNLGSSYVVYGKAGGMGSSLVQLADVVANPNLGYVTRGVNVGDEFGVGLTLGDWNGDGLVDYAGARALGDTNLKVDNGVVFMLDGNTAYATNNFTTGNDNIAATAAADRILGGQGNDTITGLGAGDVAAGGQGDDSFTITHTGFTRIDGGLGSDTLVLGGSGVNLDVWQEGSKLQHVEIIDIGGAGNSVVLRLSDALNLTDNTSQTLTVKGSSGNVTLANGEGGTWADSGDINIGGTNFDIYHHSALAAGNKLGDIYVQQGLTVSSTANAAPGGASTTVNVNGDYQLRLSDFGFFDADGGAMSGVRINSGANLFLNGTALAAGTTVSAAQIIAGKLEWHAPNLNTGTTLEAISFNVIDNAGTGSLSNAADTLTLSRYVATGSTLDAGGTRFEGVAYANINWQRAFDMAIANGGHLATFETNVGNTTAVTEAVAAMGATYSAYIGLEQSTSGAEPSSGWHWVTGNTSVIWTTGEPNNGGGIENVGEFNYFYSGSHINDIPYATLRNGYIVEYENAKFIRTGDAAQVDTMIGSTSADVMAGLGGADVLSGMRGDDRFMVPDMAFGSINGGADFDVIEFTAAADISGTALDAKVTDVEGIQLGTGDQRIVLRAADVQGLSSTTDTLYISSNGTGDTLVLTDGFGGTAIGNGAHQWHNLGTANGLTTYKYFDGNNLATTTQVLVDSTINTSANAVPIGTSSTVKVNGDYQLRLSDFGFVDADGGLMSGVKINSGDNLFLNGVALAAGSTVTAAQIVAGQLEWRAPSLVTGTITEAINFNVIDNFGSGTLATVANAITLSRTINAGASFDAGSNSFFNAEVDPGSDTWQVAYDKAIASGGHLATFESNAGNTTAKAGAFAQWGNGYVAWLGLEQSTNGAEPGGGWHWNTGNTSITWIPGEPSGDGDYAALHQSLGGSQVNDVGGPMGGRIVEYENAKFIRTGDAALIDTMTGSASADVMAGLGGADMLSGMAGDDRFMVPDMAFASVNGGTGFDVLEFTAAATILGSVLDTKLTDVEGIHLGTGNQQMVLTAAQVQGLSSTTDTLYISSNAAGDKLVLTNDTGTNAIGSGAGQWHNLGAANGLVTYQFFNSSHQATGTQVLVDSLIDVSSNATPTGTNSTVTVAGDYALRMSDFGFADADGGSMSGVQINSGGNLFLNGVALAAGSTVSTAQIIAGQLQWHAPNFSVGTTTEAIGFNVIDNYGAGTLSDAANTLTLSRTVAATSTLDAGGSRFDAVSTASQSWQAAFDQAIALGGHLATFENDVGNATAKAEAAAQYPGLGNYDAWIGLEQSTNGSEPGGGWHWSTGNSTFTWGSPPIFNTNPNNSLGESVGALWEGAGTTQVIDENGTLGGYIVEYENAMFIRQGDATLIDTMTGSAQADMMAGLGGADVLSGMAGDDFFRVPDMAFASINGGTGFDVVDFTAATTIAGATLDTKLTDVEAIYLGVGNQSVTLAVADVRGMSSTTDTLYISSSGSGDSIDLTEVIGTGANQWHNMGTSHGVATYQYFDASNVATLTRLLVDSTVAVI